jgi:hypothetical protein
MPDRWESRHGLDPADAGDAGRDPDGDNLVNVAEYQHHGDPHDPDTDADGLRDGGEVRKWQSLVDVPNQAVGRVWVAGRCPSSAPGNPCEVRPMFSVKVDVRTLDGIFVMETRTLVSGRFAFQNLKPGHYLIEALAVVGTESPGRMDLSVPRHQARPTKASITLADSNYRGAVGQATQAPTCPGPQREGEDCVEPLEGVTIEVREGDENGPQAAPPQTTGPEGYYAFRLDPGTYTLVAKKVGDSNFPVPPGPQTFTVFVEDNGPNLVNADYDTGIR